MKAVAVAAGATVAVVLALLSVLNLLAVANDS